MYYHFGWNYLFDSILPILRCMPTTLLLTVLSFVLSFVLAIILSVISMAKNRVVQAVLRVWLSLFRGTPLLCQLFLFCYGIFPFTPGLRNLSLMGQAVICLGLSFSAYMSETIRGAIASVDKGQMEACLSCGMSRAQGYVRIVLPQAFHLAIPSLMNNFIDCFKGTALCSMVGVVDMMLRAKMLANKTYHFIEIYLVVLLMYWVLNMIFVQIQKILEKKVGEKY